MLRSSPSCPPSPSSRPRPRVTSTPSRACWPEIRRSSTRSTSTTRRRSISPRRGTTSQSPRCCSTPAPTPISHAFYLAARNGHTEAAEFLLDQGADIDHRGFFGAPGLHWAAINGHLETVRHLVSRGADPAIRDDAYDADALGWAREGANEAVVAFLAG
jgi:hypothetical protein